MRKIHGHHMSTAVTIKSSHVKLLSFEQFISACSMCYNMENVP